MMQVSKCYLFNINLYHLTAKPLFLDKKTQVYLGPSWYFKHVNGSKFFARVYAELLLNVRHVKVITEFQYFLLYAHQLFNLLKSL